MKRYYLLAGAIIILLCYVALLNGCKTTEGGRYLQKSYVDPRKSVYYNKDHNAKGYVQQSLIDPRRDIQYKKNDNGKYKAKGYWQKDYIDPRKTRFYKKK
jgi:hypothetical protein